MSSTWKLKRTAQCKACPWLKDADPHDIPNGYCETKHRALEDTIAKPGELNFGSLRAMACHESHDAHCIGWLVNQAGAGNNLGLRLRLMTCNNTKAIRLRGEQHESFHDTLPKKDCE